MWVKQFDRLSKKDGQIHRQGEENTDCLKGAHLENNLREEKRKPGRWEERRVRREGGEEDGDMTRSVHYFYKLLPPLMVFRLRALCHLLPPSRP